MMALPKILVLVRHAESQANTMTMEEAIKSEIPVHELPLTEQGRKQAEITGQYLVSRFGQFDLYLTSYFKRAQETLAIMFSGVKFKEDALLAEINFGMRHVLLPNELAIKYPEEISRRAKEGLYHHRFLGGESCLDVEQRVRLFFQDVLSKGSSNRKILVVCHGTWMMLFRKYIENWTVEEFERRFPKDHPANASVTLYESQSQAGKRYLVLTEYVVPWHGKL